MSTDTACDSIVDGDRDGGSSSPVQKKRELEEEFNIQRAKMKELFLQKEEDMRKMVQEKQQLESEVLGLREEVQQLQTLSHNQRSELQNLQLLVNETVEASSTGTEQLRALTAKNLEYEQLVNQLRQQLQQQQEVSPAAFVRTLARRLGAEQEPDPPAKRIPVQNAEENELVHSLIQPLKDEITALKDKLRDTDTKLQDALKQNKSTVPGSPALSSGDNKSEKESSRACDMCANYEQQLVGAQASVASLKETSRSLQQALKLATEELEGVRSLHDETVRAWQSERSVAATTLADLRAAVSSASSSLQQRAEAAQQAEQRALHLVTTLTVDRETLQRRLDSLEKDNAYLVGQYTKKAAEMQNEVIDLPDNVEELQELSLRLREQMIVSAVGREQAAEGEQQARLQLAQHTRRLHQLDASLAASSRQLQQARDELDRLQTEREQLQELADKLRQSNDLIEKLLEDKKRLQGEVAELRNRVSSLQEDLDNSEKVQQDFVRLSQSLQVQLESIREADTEVRWQHEDDVSECPGCRQTLTNNKKKVHCRHCGRIFCAACLCRVVASGPRRRPAPVCALCATLLQPLAPPYFSTDPPRLH